jgi:hypothetical protein
MLYESVNAKRSPKKATDWNGIKKGNLLKETRLFWYQSIYNKHFSVYVKFDGGLSISFAKKLRPKKVGQFLRGWKIQASGIRNSTKDDFQMPLARIFFGLARFEKFLVESAKKWAFP